MWENETVVLVTTLKKHILNGKEKVHYGKISEDTAIPSYVKTICHRRVEEYLITESPLTFKSTPHFDIKPEDMEHLKGKISVVLRDSAVFNHKEIEEILREGLILRLDYLVKPVDTMRRLLFEKDSSIQLKEMVSILTPFNELLSYADQFTKECQRLGYTIIEQDEYGKVMTSLLELSTKENPVKLVLHDFSALTDYLSETKVEEVTRVEGSIIQEFLADRNLWGFRRAINVETKLGKEDFNAVDLEMTLKRYLELKAEFSKNGAQTSLKQEKPVQKMQPSDISPPVEETLIEEKIESSVEEDIQSQEEESKEETLVSEDETLAEGEDKDVWDIEQAMLEEPLSFELDDNKDALQETETEEEKTETKPSPKPVLDDESKVKPKKQMRIIRRDQKEEESLLEPQKEQEEETKTSPPSIGGLNQLIDDKMEKVFVKKLFNGDQDAYQSMVNKLEDAESWRVAKILIDNELFKRDVDPFSREAIKLVDLVYSRYYPEEGIGGT